MKSPNESGIGPDSSPNGSPNGSGKIPDPPKAPIDAEPDSAPKESGNSPIGPDPAAVDAAGAQLAATVILALQLVFPRIGWTAPTPKEQAEVITPAMQQYARLRPRLAIAAAAFTPPELQAAGAIFIGVVMPRLQAQAAAEQAARDEVVPGKLSSS